MGIIEDGANLAKVVKRLSTGETTLGDLFNDACGDEEPKEPAAAPAAKPHLVPAPATPAIIR